MKIFYDWFRDDIEEPIESAENFIKVFSNENPSWWKKTKLFLFENKTIIDFFKNIANSWSTEIPILTIKSCPGMHSLFKRSLLIKFPCDIFLKTEKNGNYTWRSSNSNIKIETHISPQAPYYIGENFIVIKFVIPIQYCLDKDSLAWYSDPILYKNQPYNIVPGIIEASKNKRFELNIVSLFPKEDKEYLFMAEDPLSLLTFSEKVSTFEQNSKVKKMPRAVGESKSFIGSFQKSNRH